MKKILKSCLSFILMVIVSMQLACVEKSQSSIQENDFDDGLNFIESTVDRLRDPCVLVVGDTYYMYGTGWVCYKNTSKETNNKSK